MLKANVSSDKYWWAEEDSKDVVQQLQSVDLDSIGNGAMSQAWSRNLMIYFSNIVKADNWDTSLNFAGSQGELVEMMVPMTRSLIRQLVSIVTKQKLAFSVLSETTAQGTLETARLGNALCKQIIAKQQLDIIYENMYEHSLLTGMGFFYTQWRTDRGEYFTTDKMGKDHFEGDLEISSPMVWDMKFDATIPDPKMWNWCEVRTIHNRWDLIAQFPEMAEQLKRITPITQGQNRFMAEVQSSPSDQDNIYIYAAYHKQTPAMPDGRMLVYASDECVLVDDKNYYGGLPIYVCRAEPIPGCSYGYPFISSLLPLQEMLDNTLSSIATNNSQFGVQNVTVSRGAGVTSSMINGMNFLSYTPTADGHGRPEPLQLTQSAPEAWKFIDVLKSLLLDQSMINSALRGDPPTGVTSGTAIATLTTTALESVASSSKAARDCLRRTMLGAFDVYRRFASVERDLTMSDTGNQVSTAKFKGQDLDGIKDIAIVENNPLTQTQNGRDAQADKLMSQGLIKDLKAYYAVQEGAPPSVLYEGELSEEDLVKRENEAMMNNEPVLVLNTDDHAYHIMMHAIPLKDPRVRFNGAMNKTILAHMLEHYKQAQEVDPNFAAMVATGKMPQMALPQGPMPGGSPGAPEGPEGTDPSGKPAAKPANPAEDLLGRQPGKGVA
jgi:hypothetical protein